MARFVLLPQYIVSDFVPRRPCRKCGKTGCLQLRHPILTRQGNNVRVVYPSYCLCGARDSVGFTLPILLLGYLLVHTELVHRNGKWHRSKASMCVKPERSDIFLRIIGEFEELVHAYIGVKPSRPSELDRLHFGFSEEDWHDFLRRAGWLGDDGQSDEQ